MFLNRLAIQLPFSVWSIEASDIKTRKFIPFRKLTDPCISEKRANLIIASINLFWKFSKQPVAASSYHQVNKATRFVFCSPYRMRAPSVPLFFVLQRCFNARLVLKSVHLLSSVEWSNVYISHVAKQPVWKHIPLRPSMQCVSVVVAWQNPYMVLCLTRHCSSVSSLPLTSMSE